MAVFDYFHFWSTLFSEIAPNLWRAPIIPNQFRWKNNWCIIHQWAYTLHSVNDVTEGITQESPNFFRNHPWVIPSVTSLTECSVPTPCSFFGPKFHNCNHDTKGTRSNHDQDDPNRVLFELTKSEFVDECICEQCCERFESDSTLNEHIKLQHGDLSVYKCPLCTTISKVQKQFSQRTKF